MTTVSRTFTVTPPPSVVLPYLADFANAVHWDPGTDRCTRTDTGPLAPGATWHNESTIGGMSTELTYTLEQYTDDRVVLVGRNDTATSTDTIAVEPDGAGSRITYTAELEFSGLAKLAAPAAKLVFERIGTETEKQMTEALDALT